MRDLSAADLVAIRDRWLRECALCDRGVPGPCQCPPGDYRPVMAQLLQEVERLRGAAETLGLGAVSGSDPSTRADVTDGGVGCPVGEVRL